MGAEPTSVTTSVAIDRLVYELYDITPEEIALVVARLGLEGRTHRSSHPHTLFVIPA